MSLPVSYVKTVLPFINPKTTADDFHEMVALCCSSEPYPCKAAKAIKEYLAKQRRDNSMLYNQRRNISLDQCIGDSRNPVSDWLNLSDWREWD